MPHTPQTAVTRLLQAITDARDIVPGARVAIMPQRVILGPDDGLAALKAFRLSGGDRVADPARVLLHADTLLPQPDEPAARKLKQLLEAADKAGLEVLPHAGGELADALENLRVTPGECAVSPLADVYALGSIGALGLRVTPKDVAGLFAGKPLMITVPQSVRLEITGKPLEWASGRDAFWAMLREVGRAKLAGNALELSGDGLAALPLSERAKFAALACHAGLAACFCVPDRATVQELNRRASRTYATIEPERGAKYLHSATFDLQHAVPTALPPGREDTRAVGEFAGDPITTVVITGGADDLRLAADIIKQRNVAPGVKCAVVPHTRDAFAEALKQGWISHLVDAGATVYPAGTPLQRFEDAGRCVATTVVAPEGWTRTGVAVAAATACAGTLMHPERLDASPQRDSKLSGRRRAL